MAKPVSRTLEGDAPLSTARNPAPAAEAELIPGAEVDSGDALVGRTVTINRPRAELYAYWRDFTHLPSFMENIRSVSMLDERRSHWVVAAPAERTVEWDAVITEEQPGHYFAWTSAESADIRHSGRVEFRDAAAGRGTEVTVTILYDPPAGALGKLVAKLFQREPRIQARRDLRRFKQLMETGEISTSAMTPALAASNPPRS
jgi:uncharacterized membrane protein